MYVAPVVSHLPVTNWNTGHKSEHKTTPVQVESNKSSFEKLNPAEKEVTFLVEKVEKTAKKQFRYLGVGNGYENVIFFAGEEFDYVGRVGKARAFSQRKDGMIQYWVRHRDIVWGEDKEEATGEVVTLHDGKKILKSILKETAEKKTCVTCREAIDVSDPSKLLMSNSGNLVCHSCIVGYERAALDELTSNHPGVNQ